MIDRASFAKEWIERQGKGKSLGLKLIIERTIHAFYLLQKISKSQLYGSYIFKGGSAAMLLWQEAKRFSVDIDLLVNPSMERRYDSIIRSLKDDVFYRIEEDVRKPSGIPKRHYKFYYHSAIDPSKSVDYVLLDAVFAEPRYTQVIRKEISFPWLIIGEPIGEVPIPSPADMLGDKLCAFAPHTVGVLFSDGKDVETMKQLFDIGRLLELPDIDIKTAFKTYKRLVKEQAAFRSLTLSPQDAMDDALEVCRTILSQGKREGCGDIYSHVKRGFDALHSFIPGNYTEIDWIRDSAKTYMLLSRNRFPQKTNCPASNNGTFVGRRYRLIKLALQSGIADFMTCVANDPRASR